MDEFAFEHPGTPLRQGDVLRRVPTAGHNGPRWLFILTADCDIAQRKHADFLTCLEIISCNEYYENHVCVTLVEQELQNSLREFADLVQRIDSRRDPSVSRLSKDDIFAWLDICAPSEIARRLDARHKETEKLSLVRQKIQLLAMYSLPSPRDRIEALWKAIEKPPSKISLELRNIFQKHIPNSFFFLPYLPGDKENGFFVLVNKIHSVSEENIRMASQHAAQTAAASYARIGHLPDRVRFSIVQRAVYIFSRIGFETAYESEERTALDILVDQLTPPPE